MATKRQADATFEASDGGTPSAMEEA